MRKVVAVLNLIATFQIVCHHAHSVVIFRGFIRIKLTIVKRQPRLAAVCANCKKTYSGLFPTAVNYEYMHWDPEAGG